MVFARTRGEIVGNDEQGDEGMSEEAKEDEEEECGIRRPKFGKSPVAPSKQDVAEHNVT